MQTPDTASQAIPSVHHRKAWTDERATTGTTAVALTSSAQSDGIRLPRSRFGLRSCLQGLCCRKRKGDDDDGEDGFVYHEALWKRAVLACLCCSSACLCFVIVVLLIALIVLGVYTYNVDQVNVRVRNDLAGVYGKVPAATVAPPARTVFERLKLHATGTQLRDFSAALHNIETHMGSDGVRKLAAFLEDETMNAPFVNGRDVPAAVLHGRGYQPMSGEDASEEEVWQPMDDVALLQWRHVLSASVPGDASSSSSLLTSAASAAAKVRLYGASSVLNRRFYYGVRRLERAAPYASSSSVETTKAWYDAVAGSAMWSVHGDAGAADADATSRANSVRLRVADVSAAYADEVDAYESHGDVLPPRADTRADVPTVFVSLASYRDAQCPPTLVDLFRKAKNAHRVYVGLAEQNSATDLSCLAPLELHEPSACLAPAGVSEASSDAAMTSVYGGGALRGAGGASGAVADFRRSVCFYAEHVRVRMIDAGVAKGPTYGRYMAMLLYRGESLTLVLDSHNRFTPFWDTLATHQYYRYNDPKTVLSHYPESLDLKHVDRFRFFRDTTSYLCGGKVMDEFGYVRLNAVIYGKASFPGEWRNLKFSDPYTLIKSTDLDPATNFRLPQPWVAGGFLFANSSIMREVPFDPHLPHIFDGEEVLYSVRLWTHGYNMFSPIHNIAYHFYGRPDSPKVWVDRKAEFYRTQRVSRRRIHFYLQSHKKGGALFVNRDDIDAAVTIDVDRYGIGKARTVAQWYDYAAVDPVNYTVEKRFC